MLNGFESSLDARLKEAESAEEELLKLQPLADEAPKLRLEKAKEQKRQERDRAKQTAMQMVSQSSWVGRMTLDACGRLSMTRT